VVDGAAGGRARASRISKDSGSVLRTKDTFSYTKRRLKEYMKNQLVVEEGTVDLNADGQRTVLVEGVDDGGGAAADFSVGCDLRLHFGFIKSANSIPSTLFDERVLVKYYSARWHIIQRTLPEVYGQAEVGIAPPTDELL